MLFSSKSSGGAGAGEFMVVEGQEHEDGGVVVDVVIFDHRRVRSAGGRNSCMRAFVDRVHEFVRCKLKDNKSFVAWLLPSPEWVSKGSRAAWLRALVSFVSDYSNRLYVDMLESMVVSLFYGPRLVSAHQIDPTSVQNRSLLPVIRVHEQLMVPLKRGHVDSIARDARNKNSGISGLTLVGSSDAVSVLLFLDYDHEKMVCKGEHKVVGIKVESDSKDKRAACKVMVYKNWSNACEVFSDSVPTFQIELKGFSEEYGERCLLNACAGDIGLRAIAAPLTIVDEFHVWMAERKFKENFVVLDRSTPLHRHLETFERLVWLDLRRSFGGSDESANCLLALLFWYRPYVVWSEQLGDLSDYFSKHDIVDVFGNVSVSWSIKETTSPEESLSHTTISVVSPWCSSLMQRQFPDISLMTPRADVVPRDESPFPECHVTSALVGGHHHVAEEEVDLANASARQLKLKQKQNEAEHRAQRLRQALSSLSRCHERNGDGDLRVSSAAVSARFRSGIAASSKLSKS